MITGDHAVTAQAIGEQLGSGPARSAAASSQVLSDEELARRLPELHVFGRVSPEDKLRLARTMQAQGLIVAMTGDAVNDAAALKQADIGVAMGSGSEVTKQAARMILTDDNFGTLVHAVEIGRRVYDKITSYVRFQMTQLLGLVMLFVAATAFNVNEGVAMTPTMVLFLLFFATAMGVVIIAVDPGDPDVMRRPPRDPSVPIANRFAIMQWVVYAFALFVAAFLPLVAGPDEPSTEHASASMTMTFVVMGLGTVFNALTNRRDPTSGLVPPILKAIGFGRSPSPCCTSAPSSASPGLPDDDVAHRAAWLEAIGLALVLPIVVEGWKWIRRRRAPAAAGSTRARRGSGARHLHVLMKERWTMAKTRSMPPTSATPEMKRKEYEREMALLHGELVALQEWVKANGAKICVVFEGRDTAGKGGTIKRITERVSPRVFRVVALPAPTDREKSQMYVQRYIRHFPSAGRS